MNLRNCVSLAAVAAVLFVAGCADPVTGTQFDLDAMAAGAAHPLPHTDAPPVELKDVLKTDQPVVVDFSATWCGPCQALSPELEKLATAYEGRVTVVKVDTDESPELAEQFRVTSLPTVLIFQNAAVVRREVGFDQNLRFKFAKILNGLLE